MAVNISLAFSNSNGGQPILVPTSAYPGQLIHESTLEKDFIWMWASYNEFVPYTEYVYLKIVKGSPALGYSDDSMIYIPSGKKVLIENGTILTGNNNIYAYLDPDASSITNVSISISGYVHRRIES